jgi:large subunit ribosomal protein L29
VRIGWIERIEKEAVMSKAADLREQNDEQLEMLLREVQSNLFRLRLQSETERLEAPSEIVKAKREIARIRTVLRLRAIERQRSLVGSAVAARTP